MGRSRTMTVCLARSLFDRLSDEREAFGVVDAAISPEEGPPEERESKEASFGMSRIRNSRLCLPPVVGR